ncbi:MAG: Bicarbonate transport system permease protein CmpB [Verrucomicrobiaceae bacterium]|nr:Bicarbonate transport system permease protein CmpB [Verrucomicrobiaceae bacterium]
MSESLTPLPAEPLAPALVLVPASSAPVSRWRAWLTRTGTIRDVPGQFEGIAFGGLSLALVLLMWWFLTRGDNGQRIVDGYTLPSLTDTIASFPSLWFQRELSISALTSLARVVAGFAIATAIAVPLGVIAGSYLRVNAFLRPISLFGRNVPIAALIPLTLIWFGLGEVQKVMFIFFATVAFVLFDTTNAVQAVQDRYIDTSYTLGVHATRKKGARLAALFGLIYGGIAALGWFVLSEDKTLTLAAELASSACWERFAGAFIAGFALWYPIESHQALRKVILPLAMPDIVNSLRLIFGLAFGYIMLAEVINAQHGLGALIIISQRQGPREHIYLCLVIISLMAWAIDRLIMRLQRHLFPYLKHGPA